MGIFGNQAKVDVKAEAQTPVEEPEEKFDNLPAVTKPRSNTVIAKGVTLSGALHGEGVVQIEGNVEGEISLDGSVIIATTGIIKGPITADVIRVAGHAEGNMLARDHLRLEKTGTVEGDVTTASLVVEDGGRLNGRSTMVQGDKDLLSPARPIPLDDLQFGSNYKMEKQEETEH